MRKRRMIEGDPDRVAIHRVVISCVKKQPKFAILIKHCQTVANISFLEFA